MYLSVTIKVQRYDHIRSLYFNPNMKKKMLFHRGSNESVELDVLQLWDGSKVSRGVSFKDTRNRISFIICYEKTFTYIQKPM